MRYLIDGDYYVGKAPLEEGHLLPLLDLRLLDLPALMEELLEYHNALQQLLARKREQTPLLPRLLFPLSNGLCLLLELMC